MDFSEARRWMVDGQVRPNRVNDPRLLDAMRSLPREAFVPPVAAALAYADEEVPLPGGRALPRPMVLAQLIQLAAPKAEERVLVVCAGTGYGAALLALLGCRVVALEPDQKLRDAAAQAMAMLSPGAIRIEPGEPAAGCAAAAPYDLILIEGEVPAIPAALSDQLAEGGRLVAVIGDGRGRGQATLGRKLGGALSLHPAFDAAIGALPAFRPAPGFVF
jgi:protein-L-isoaspartate(D-aspartate) O-methyltransferase